MTYHSGRHFLQLPGPTNVPDRVLRAMARPTIDHRGPEFRDLALGLLAGLREVFRTEHPVLVYPSSATGAWESALTNTLSPGDRVVAFAQGFFADKWARVAGALGLDVHVEPQDPRRAVDPARVADILRADRAHAIRAVLVVHNETSTGVVADVEAIGAASRATGHPALLMVDAVSSLGAMDFRHDAWGVDVTVSGSQKGLMLPPGLAFVAVGPRALDAHGSAALPRAYWDWSEQLAFNERGFFPYTPATNLLYGLEQSLAMLREEGMEAVFVRHARFGEATRRAVAAWELETFAADAGEASAALTAVRVPEGHDADAVRSVILERFDMSLGTGLGPLKGKALPHRPPRRPQRPDPRGDARRRGDGARAGGRAAREGRRGRRHGGARGGGRAMRGGPRATRWLAGAGALVAVAILAACGEPSGLHELKFGHVGEPGSLFALSADEFARRANARLPADYRVVVYGSSQLGGDELLLQKIKLGTVDFALPSTVMSSQIDAFGLFEMPYLVRDRAHMRAIEQAVVWPDLASLAEEAGYHVIAVWENGFRHVTNSRRPIVRPTDLAGIKLRTPRGVWRVKLFQTLGANPTPMALSEVFVGLQTGVIDGQENPLAQIWGSKLYEVQKYLSLTSHVYTPAYVVVSPSQVGRPPARGAHRARGGGARHAGVRARHGRASRRGAARQPARSGGRGERAGPAGVRRGEPRRLRRLRARGARGARS